MPVGRVRQTGDGGSPSDWYYGLPPVTRLLFTSVVGLCILTSINIVSPMQLHLSWPHVYKGFQAWRLYTNAVYYGPPSFPFLMNVMFLAQYSPRYEQDAFNTGGGGGSADYALMLIFGFLLMDIIGFTLLPMPFMGSPMLMMIIYVWSRKTPNAQVSFWGIPIKSVYTPWALAAFHLFTGGSVIPDMIGIGVGHAYYFLVDVMPDVYDVDLLKTPRFLIELFGHSGPSTGGVNNFAAPGRVAAPGGVPRPGGGGGYSWGGSGRVLGTAEARPHTD